MATMYPRAMKHYNDCDMTWVSPLNVHAANNNNNHNDNNNNNNNNEYLKRMPARAVWSKSEAMQPSTAITLRGSLGAHLRSLLQPQQQKRPSPGAIM